MLTHGNLVANAYQAASWDPLMRRGEETFLAVLPMFHVYGLTMCLVVNMLVGGTLVLIPTFDLGLVFAAIDKWQPTVFPGVPPMYDQIVRSRRTPRHDLRSIRTCVSGAMRLPPETIAQFEAVTGGRLVEGYGLTESSPVALANPLDEHARPGTIGVPLPGTDIRIADLDDPARDAPAGTPGELCVRGPQVFAGYWRGPSEEMLRDGWLYTGDVVVQDADGFVTLVDRKRDVIMASGFSIFPTEIEEVLAQHPAVADCAVVGVPHFYRGETAKAFVVLREDRTATEKELRAFCAARLVAYKVPTGIEFRTELPHNLMGKVLRRVLRAEHEELRGRRPKPTPNWAAETVARPAPKPAPAATPAAAAVSVTAAAPVVPAAVPASGNGTHAAPATSTATATPVDEDDLIGGLERLAKLYATGALTEDEYHAAKRRLLEP
jgi:long-chain acyl-CoA synthetase